MRLPLLRRNNAKREPESVPVAVPELSGAEIAALYFGERVGGDFYDFIRPAPHLVLFGLLDVAGRYGENRAIVGAAQQTFRETGKTLFSRDDINEAESMVELSLEVNRTVLQAAKGPRSCPAFLACYNEAIGTVCYSNAGHTPALLRDDSSVTPLNATGLPLGLFSHVTHDACTVALEQGSALVLVSRGVTEAKHRGKEYGIERVEAVLRDSAAAGAEQLCGEILDDVERFMGKRPADNDVTALALTRRAVAGAASAD